MTSFAEALVLEGERVLLEPLTTRHVPGLADAAADGCLWELLYTGVPEPDDTVDYVQQALAMQVDGLAVPFVVRRAADGRVVGSTRYCNIDAANRRLEIGYTWYAASAQRTAVNSECKLLLLQHAFETLDCIAVEFRTHWLNQRSRAAIARLGAKQDGVLRNHRILPDGSLRDTVVFSILASEWPAVKQLLRTRLARGHEA
ncbi:MAG: GNAT family protein [Rhodanobacteraceae bacterium]